MNSSQTSYSQVESSTVQTVISHVTGGGNKSCTFTPQIQRIEYIDALRGFTMILVVMWHISLYCLQSTHMISYNSIMAQFRMPLFFFVSGFVFYKDTIWKKFTLITFIKKKIAVQIITPTLFLALYIYIHKHPIMGLFFNDHRYGYWFTYVLFLYYLFYICITFTSQFIGIKSIGHDIMLFIGGGVCYIVFFVWKYLIEKDIANLLLIIHWRYFIYFVLGIIAKKHFAYFRQLLDNRYVFLFIIIFYFLYNFFDKYILEFHRIIYVVLFNIRDFCGVLIVFTFFRKYSSAFTKEKWIGRSLQYIGQRTLDIYLLHYFFLPWGLASAFTFFADNKLPSLEIFASLFISLLVISLCLIISNVYRLSPWIEQNMFGVKKKKESEKG